MNTTLSPVPHLPPSVVIMRWSAAGWRRSANTWRDLARAALTDSDLHTVIFALNNAAQRNDWAYEAEQNARRLETQEATA